MKNPPKLNIFFFLILFICVSAFGTPNARFTADYYLASPKKYEGKSISIYINRATPSRYETTPDGYISYWISTKYNNKIGGYITALVEESQSELFFRNYNKDYFSDGKKIEATFLKIGRQYVIIIGDVKKAIQWEAIRLKGEEQRLKGQIKEYESRLKTYEFQLQEIVDWLSKFNNK